MAAVASSRGAVRPAGPTLYSVRVRDIWRFVRTQRLSFWLVCVYLFLEYVRPQQVYESLAVLPWAQACIIACGIVYLLEGGRFSFPTAIDGLVGAFTVVLLISCVQAYSPETSFSKFELFGSWLIIYALITNVVNTERRFLVFMLSFLLYNLKMSQFATRTWGSAGFRFQDWGATGAPGWFHNSGEMGIEMTIFLAVSTYWFRALRPHWSWAKKVFFGVLPLTAVTATIASSSRGAQLGILGVVLWMMLKSRYRVRSFVILGALVALAIAVVPERQMERFRSAGEDKTSEKRLTYWRHGIEIANNHPLFGIGYANWQPYHNRYYGPGQLPHNVFVEAGAELGYVGFAAYLLLILGTFVTNHRTRRLAAKLGRDGLFLDHMAHGLDGALVGFLISGFFVTVMYYPFFWINLGMTVALHRITRQRAGRVVPPPAGSGVPEGARVLAPGRRSW